MNMEHWTAHQQALIKNNICIAVLAFPEHNEILMQDTFAKFDYDQVVDLCQIQAEASLDASWDGSNFYINDYPSWTLGEDLKWHAPTPKPDGDFYWNEESQVWVEFTSTSTT